MLHELSCFVAWQTKFEIFVNKKLIFKRNIFQMLFHNCGGKSFFRIVLGAAFDFI